MLARPTEDSVEPPTADATHATPIGERSAVFRHAERHSRIVRSLKIALPSLAVVMAAAFVVQSFISTPSAVAITADDSAVAEGKLVMANPKLEGFTPENRPYAVSALRAVQDISNEALVELQSIAATVPLDDKVSATVDAARGIFDQSTSRLTIDTDINITTTSGAVGKLLSATLDMAAGRMWTDKPVEIRSDKASIRSDAMSVEDNGKVVVFEKRVRVHIVPPKSETASQ